MLSLKSKIPLFPYYITLKIRNFLYNKDIIKSHSYNIKTICVGNITVGGTGKTPHCEMIIRELQDSYNIILLSRGYKRETKGFKIVECSDSFETVGDEPLQIKQKFPNITVAVCEDRCYGIEELQKRCDLSGDKETIIILDDAFQYRKIKAHKNIILVNYNRPIDKDNLLPIGMLRDLPERIKSADIVIITNYPFRNEATEDDMSPTDLLNFFINEKEVWKKRLGMLPQQKLYFSAIKYLTPSPVFEDKIDKRYLYAKSAILFSGIANNGGFKDYISSIYAIKDSITFSDHRKFSKGDIKLINILGEHNPRAIIITTEKDSKRLLYSDELSLEVKQRLFYLPITTEIITKPQKEEFFKSITE